MPDGLLRAHFDAHPRMEIRDALKFLHQRHMGPGHLIRDEAAVRRRLEDEWHGVEADPAAPLAETLGNGLCRLDLAACKGRGLSPETVFRLFLLTARKVKPDRAGLEKDLDLVYGLPFPEAEVRAALERYRAAGCPMLSHSGTYRAAYAPAYRVVLQRYVSWLPLLSAAEGLRAERPPALIAVDGPCASGKTTLGADLAEILGCPVVHMDDFFLRPEQRTPARLDTPGGNIDWERFRAEVLLPLKGEGRAVYRPWDCHTGSFSPEHVEIGPAPLVVVEGSYALHPELRELYDLRVWLEAPWEVREQRLLDRGGSDGLERFRSVWIPLEDRYFAACGVRECCWLALSGA